MHTEPTTTTTPAPARRMATRLQLADGTPVTRLGPVTPSGRVLVQHEASGLLDVVDAATLTASEHEAEQGVER